MSTRFRRSDVITPARIERVVRDLPSALRQAQAMADLGLDVDITTEYVVSDEDRHGFVPVEHQWRVTGWDRIDRNDARQIAATGAGLVDADQQLVEAGR